MFYNKARAKNFALLNMQLHFNFQKSNLLIFFQDFFFNLKDLFFIFLSLFLAFTYELKPALVKLTL